jgi:hypothetical protein
MNHVEAGILNLVTKLYGTSFQHWKLLRGKRRLSGPSVVTFDREVQFYIAYLEHIALSRKGTEVLLSAHLPGIKEVYNYQGFDLAWPASLGRPGHPCLQ